MVVQFHYCCRDSGEINGGGYSNTNVLYILLRGGRELARFNRGRDDAD